jgi:exodeoxyribonuclease V alpha subunit
MTTPAQLSLAARGALAPFAAAGLLSWSDCQLAGHLSYLHGEPDDHVTLAAALTLAALRAGSVCLDLAHADQAIAPDPADEGADPPEPLPWPDPAAWAGRLAASRMVTSGAGPADGRPLRLADGLLYLERSWDDQVAVAESIRRRTGPAAAVPPNPDDRQAEAVAVAAAHRFAVIGGGPGTGKTTTVARLLAALADTERPPRILLAAPTGKAAARLDEAVRDHLAQAGLQALADAIPPAATIHRLLGIKPWGAVDHGPANPLAADLVVVDEVSMLSLHHMRLLLDAVPDSTRLVLVGDPDQLASVESGAVLADLVATPGAVPFVRLDRNYRFSGALTDLAAAIRAGDAEAVLALLAAGDPAVEFTDLDLVRPDAERHLGALRATVVDQATAVLAALARWEASHADADLWAALAAANAHRLLCAHRRGPFGVTRWHHQVAAWLAQSLPAAAHGPWPAGLPVQVTRNDEVLGVFNGDAGVIAHLAGSPRAVLPTAAGLRLFGPAELDGLEPIHATTIHKAQGSQFDAVTVIVPAPGAALLTRELLYTAVTRAKTMVRLIGTREAVAHAVTHEALRASGLSPELRRP